MTLYPKSLKRLMPNFVYAFTVSAFFLVAALLYEPRALSALMMSGTSYHEGIYDFNIVTCFAIILVTLLATRLVYFFLRKSISKGLGTLSMWCLGEIVVCCAFTGLYLVLIDHSQAGGYFSYFGRSISAIGSSLIYPYIILTMFYICLDKSAAPAPGDEVRLKFYDSRHQLKFITEASAVLYLESDENYVIIHYLENGMEKRFQLRNSMKNLEPLCEKAGFARTHRCYIINPIHVKLIRKDPGGFNFADLGLENNNGIPISKKYYDSVSTLL